MSSSLQICAVVASRETAEQSRTRRQPHSTADIAMPTMRVVNRKGPLVRKSWLIAMAIVFVALIAVVFIVTYTSGVG